mgnify:FL=1
MGEKLIPEYCKEEIAANPLPYPGTTAPQTSSSQPSELPSVAESS